MHLAVTTVTVVIAAAEAVNVATEVIVLVVTAMTPRPSSAAMRLPKVVTVVASKAAANSSPEAERDHASDHPGGLWWA